MFSTLNRRLIMYDTPITGLHGVHCTFVFCLLPSLVLTPRHVLFFLYVIVVQKTTGAQDPFGQFPVCRHGNEKVKGGWEGKDFSCTTEGRFG